MLDNIKIDFWLDHYVFCPCLLIVSYSLIKPFIKLMSLPQASKNFFKANHKFLLTIIQFNMFMKMCILHRFLVPETALLPPENCKLDARGNQSQFNEQTIRKKIVCLVSKCDCNFSSVREKHCFVFSWDNSAACGNVYLYASE